MSLLVADECDVEEVCLCCPAVTTGAAGVGLKYVAGGFGAWVVAAARFAVVDDVAAADAEEAAGAREIVLDGRGRVDIVGTVVDGLGDVTDLVVVGSFFAVVELDADGASDRRFEAVVDAVGTLVFAAVVVAVRVGTELEGASDRREPLVVVAVGFFRPELVVPLLRAVLEVGFACEDVPMRLGRAASFAASLAVPGFAIAVAFTVEGLFGVEVGVSAAFEGPLGKTAFSTGL